MLNDGCGLDTGDVLIFACLYENSLAIAISINLLTFSVTRIKFSSVRSSDHVTVAKHSHMQYSLTDADAITTLCRVSIAHLWQANFN